MSADTMVKILCVEEDASLWPRLEAFFVFQTELVGARPHVHLRRRLPERAAGFDLVSLDGRGLIDAVLTHEALRADLRQTAIVNLHADATGITYGHLRRLLGRGGEGARSDGLWVFPQSWMAPWFQECLEFPELGLVRSTPLPPRPLPPDRTWDRRSIRAFQVPLGLPEALALRG